MNINLWETNLGKNDYTFSNDIQDLFRLYNESDMNFIVRDSFNPQIDECIDSLEKETSESLKKENATLVYNDKDHQIAIKSNKAILNTSFFNEHRIELANYCKNRVKNAILSNKSYVMIPNFCLDEELIRLIIEHPNITYEIKQTLNEEINISDSVLKEIKDKHIEFKYTYKNSKSIQISTKYVFNKNQYITFDSLKDLKNITFSLPLNESFNYDDLKYVREDAIITLSLFGLDLYVYDNEVKYYQEVLDFLKKISNINHKVNIKIVVNNRNLFNESNILNSIPANVNLTFKNEYYDYDIESYKREEEELDRLAAPIKNSNLSPFEKYLAVYNIVKQYKQYKKHPNKKDRYYRDILFKGVDGYIVCDGFSNLLLALLYRVGIPCMKYSASVDISLKDKDLTDEATKDIYNESERNIEYGEHARNLIRIVDEKYGINGIYLADSTWDNDLRYDKYLNALLTFDRKREAVLMESLMKRDLLLDFHGYEDFYKKINYYFKHEFSRKREEKAKYTLSNYEKLFDKNLASLKNTDINKYKLLSMEYEGIKNKEYNSIKEKIKAYKSLYQKYHEYFVDKNSSLVDSEKLNEQDIIEVYKQLFKQVIEILSGIDRDKDNEIFNEFGDKILSSKNLSELEELMTKFLANYCKYIVPLSNKKVSIETILKAARVARTEISKWSKMDLWDEKVLEDNLKAASVKFPYKYNEGDPEGYLEYVKPVKR